MERLPLKVEDMEILERKNNSIRVKDGENGYWTLRDILPDDDARLDVLIVGKVPAPKSVAAGHYFQGNQGRFFWCKLVEYGILDMYGHSYEDDALLDNNIGITDVVKEPKEFGDEPTAREYSEGYSRINDLVGRYKPKVLIFVYKKVFDKLLPATVKSVYGFNPEYSGQFGGAKVFVFPMMGTPCTAERQRLVMEELQQEIQNIRNL